MAEPSLVIELLGGFLVNGSSLPDLHSDKERWLLALLALRPEREWSRKELAERLWPDLPNAPEYLVHGLSRLRRALQEWGEDGRLPQGTRGSAVRFEPEGVQIGVCDFEAACAAGDRERARALYRGPFMLNVDEEGLSEEARVWAAWERARLEMKFRASQGDFPGLRAAWSGLRRLHEVSRDRLRGPHQRHLRDRWADPEESTEKRECFRELEARSAQSPISLPPVEERQALEAAVGALPLDSRFYVARPVDAEFHSALACRDSIVLLRGPRQVGKTSLLARGVQRRREAGDRVVCTDFQSLSAEELGDARSLLHALARSVARKLGLEAELEAVWSSKNSAGTNLTSFVLAALGPDARPLVWGLDEVDRLFGCPFHGEVFGLFRSWHNQRALEPGAGWSAFTLAMTYSTEPRLFIPDLRQSPFNVGTKLTLEDFTLEQVADLNRRCRAPLSGDQEIAAFRALVGGHPYLVRQGLREMAVREIRFVDLERGALHDDSVFGDHLRHLGLLLRRDPELCDAVRGALQGRGCGSIELFHRLRSAGVLGGELPEEVRLRCGLYERYLRAELL